MAIELNFREKGVPRKIRNRILLLLVIFVVSLMGFQVLLNRQEETTEITMTAASFPVVTIEAYGAIMGELHGYASRMDACYMRDAIVPLESDRTLDTTIHTYGYDIDSVSYELRSLDTERKIADTEVTDWIISGDEMQADIRVENLVDQGEEYLLILILHGEQDLYYYTRIMLSADEYEKPCLEFAQFFHETALGGDQEALAPYMETSEYTDKDTLADVGIDSTVNQVAWQGFHGTVVDEPVISITDMNDTYISLMYNYRMQEQDGSSINYYNVEEYFKLRYTTEQIYLLDYRRTMEQILQAGTVNVQDNVVDLGVAGQDMEYLSNETGTVVSFVQAGELYEYNQNKKKLTKVFGFIDDPLDIRQNYGQHTIRILNIDETGNMDFLVYGYMNRGAHEGECGMDLYHYDSSTQEASEQLFIASTYSYQVLNANFSDLLYENVRGDFYIMMGGTLAKIGVNDLTTEEMMTGLRSDQYAVSASGQYVAWISEGEMASSISVMNLETEEIRTIEAEAGTLLRPLAFMTEDLVYGIADESDIVTDTVGTMIYPMKEIRIVSTSAEDFTELKSYAKSGIYVTEVEKDAFTLYLTRVVPSEGTYVETTQDTIKDSAGEQNKVVDVSTRTQSGKGVVTILTMASLDDKTTIKTVAENKASLAVASQAKNLSVSVAQQEETYFVYVGNRVTMTSQNLNRAIAEAYDQMGIVVDNKQNYIWKRGRSSYVNAFSDVEVGSLDAEANSSAGAISALLVRKGDKTEVHSLLERGETPMTILQRALKDDLVLDLTGCTLTQVLYYVSQGAPVYARTGEDEALLIIGYDAANIIVYQPTTDTYQKIASDDATALFEAAGNVFISYVE